MMMSCNGDVMGTVSLSQALQFGFLDFNNFSVEEYEFYEVGT